MSPTLQSTYRQRSRVFDALSGVSPWHRLYREFTEAHIQEALRKLSAGPCRIVDAGGGTGLTAQWLARQGHQVVLVDAVPEMLEYAHQKARHDPFEIILADLAEIGFLSAQSFDAVICNQVLNFCPDPVKVLQGFHRVLRSGGFVLADVDTAVRWCLLEALDGHMGNALAILQEDRDRDRNIVGADYYFYSQDLLRQMAESCGLLWEKSWGIGYVAPYVHVYAKSTDFLTPENLTPQARFFAGEDNYAELKVLETALAARNLPEETAGYLQFVCRKP